MMGMLGLPLLFLELAIGQYAAQGPATLFGRLAPAMKGLGLGMIIKSIFTALFYSITIAWTLHYAFASFQV